MITSLARSKERYLQSQEYRKEEGREPLPPWWEWMTNYGTERLVVWAIEHEELIQELLVRIEKLEGKTQ